MRRRRGRDEAEEGQQPRNLSPHRLYKQINTLSGSNRSPPAHIPVTANRVNALYGPNRWVPLPVSLPSTEEAERI